MSIIFDREKPPERLDTGLSAIGWMSLVNLAALKGWDKNSATHEVSGGNPVVRFGPESAASFARALEDGLLDLAPARDSRAMRDLVDSIDATVEGDQVTFEDGAQGKLTSLLSRPGFLFQALGGYKEHITKIVDFARRGPFGATNLRDPGS